MKKFLSIAFMILTLFLVASCQMPGTNPGGNTGGNNGGNGGTPVDPYSGEFGKPVEEDLTTKNILDDNYRNYYEIFVQAFSDSNFDGVGDLRGVINKLDYLQDLGYTGIWLMPIHPSNSYHKYDVIDFYQVHNKYGTIDDLKELIDECHKRDIKIIIDLVLNHSSKGSEYFAKACAAYDKKLKGIALTEEDKKYVDFYCFFPTQSSAPSGIAINKVSSNYNFYYECNFSDQMPEFNCDSQYVKDEFKNIVKYYLDMGIDGFRLDAVKYYYYNNDAKNIAFLREFNSWCKAINPKSYIVGECWSGTSVIKNYYTSGVDSFFNFSESVSSSGTSGSLNGINPNGNGINTYYNQLVNNYNLAGNSIAAPFLDNHDMPRYTFSSNLNKNKFVFGLLAMMNGTIFSYYGDEVGLVGSNKSPNPDQNVRQPIKWGDFTQPDCVPVSGITSLSYPYGTVQDQIDDPNSILNYYSKALLIRNQNPEIARGTIKQIKLDKANELLIISKTYNGKTIGIVYNFSNTNKLTIKCATYGFNQVVGQIVADSNHYVGEAKDGSIIIPPYSIVILR